MLMPRWRGGRAVMSRPSTQSVPEVGSSRPASSRQAVVLPLPDGPSRTMNSPVPKARSSPSSATVPSGKTLRTARNSTAIAQALIAPKVSPRTRCFWTRKVNTTIGRVATTATAATCPHSVPCGVTRPGMPTVSVRPSKATRTKA